MEPPPMQYQIHVRGVIDPARAPWFGNAVIAHTADGDTLIVGFVRDQAELFGILMKVRDLCLVLISVLPIDHDSTMVHRNNDG